MKLLNKICLLGLLAALPVFAQTNSGITRITNTSVIDSGAHCFETTTGAGPNVCLVNSSSGVLQVTLGDGVTGGAIALGSPVLNVANEGATGTTVNKLAKLTGAPSTAIIAATTDNKSGIVRGIVTGGAGITGNAQITLAGSALCAFDATAVTAGDFVTISSTVAGKCHDAGSTQPLDGSQLIGVALATGNASTSQNVFLIPGINNSLAIGVTGSGSAVLATSAAITSPVITTGLTASGSASNDFSASTGTFKTSTGAATIGPGAVGLTGVTTLLASAAGNAPLNFTTGGTAPTTVVQGGVYWEPTKNALVQGETAGEPLVIGGALIVLPQQTGLTTITTAQTLNGLTAVTLPAGALNVVGKTLHVHGMLIFSNAVTTPTVAVSLKIGTVVELIPTSASNANSNTNSPVYFDFWTTTAATGATGNDQAHGYIVDNTASAVIGAAMNTFGDANAGVSSNWDHTAQQTVVLQITCGGAACTAATLNQATFEIVN